jgi:thiamine-phosphate pyrophosphorylase
MTKRRRFNISGLYAITPDELNTEVLCAKVEAALQGGARCVQYRNKLANDTLRRVQATALLALCRQHQVPFIINDHLDLCEQIGADGVHLGATDGDLTAARKRLGEDKMIGASCYNRPELAQKATAEGASYVAFGACFASGTKPHAVKASLDLFSGAKPLNVPLVAIGGITLENASQVIQAGADAIAVVGALFESPNITDAGQKFNSLFHTA